MLPTYTHKYQTIHCYERAANVRDAARPPRARVSPFCPWWLLLGTSLFPVHSSDDFRSLAQCSGSSMNIAAINAFARTFLQDDLHSRAMCSSKQHMTNFLKIAMLKTNARVYLQNTENANTNKSHIQGSGSNQISTRLNKYWKD